MHDKFIPSANERFHALKKFHSNFELLFYLMDQNYLSQLPENNLKAICLTIAKAVGFSKTEVLDLWEEVKSLFF